jgi:pilus assembly protein CpaD
MKFQNLAPLAALGLMVSACGGSGSLGLDSVHQPVVSRADYSFDVATGGGGLNSNETARLVGWFDALRLGYGDRVAIDFGSNYDDGGAKAAIASIAASYGILLQDVPPMTSGNVAPGSARVIISRLKASVPSCPDWAGNKFENVENRTSSNYGCATNTNLAAMIANPEDLVRGASANGITDANAATKGVNDYRRRSPSGAGGAINAESAGGK